MKVLVFPRDPNPYQRLLYREMESAGVQVTYLGQVTPSHTLNVLLLPAEMACRRLAGARMVHLHWVFGFSFPGSGRIPGLRRASQAWFRLWLGTVRLFRMRLAWTAHNVLPHSPVFADDAAARRSLVAACDVVFAHSRRALTELADLGAAPRRAHVIPHGPFPPDIPARELRAPGTGGKATHFLFFGKIAGYKGVTELLEAFAALPVGTAARLTIAGQCDDPHLRARLTDLARHCGKAVTLRLMRIADEDVTPLLASADAVVLPFRRVTTSGSVMLALAHARPAVIPDLPALADLPDAAVIRYDGSVQSLTGTLRDLATATPARFATWSAAALTSSSPGRWREAAAQTTSAFADLLGDKPARQADAAR